MRERFVRKLNELRDEILKMGSMVDEELKLSLKALAGLDTALATQVFEADTAVNETRYTIEEQCFALIVTQQPAAGDLRAIVAVMNMIVDLERMGDQAKGIAKVIPHLMRHPDPSQLPELKRMGELVGAMLRDGMRAYATENVELARLITGQDDEVDKLFARVFTRMMEQMAETKDPGQVEASYEVIRAAQELERFGDLATNLAERVIYIVTGHLKETNIS